MYRQGSAHLDYRDAIRSRDPLFRSAGLALDLVSRVVSCPMAMFLSREGPKSPRLAVVKADPALGTDPDAFARESLEVCVDQYPILDAAVGSGWVWLVDEKALGQRPQFSETDYAKSFLPRYGLETIVVLYLSVEGEDPDAAVALFRTGGEPAFTDREKNFLRHTGPVLAHSYHTAIEAEAGFPERKGRLSVLTERELEVARLAALGRRNNEIAETLQISPGTVKTHLRNIYSKLDVDSRVQLALRLSGH